jgi:putative molybdopterin biosynthesis protein
MDKIEVLYQFDQIKALADPRRLEILRLLLAEPASLTQLGTRLGQHPARVRHHMQKLEKSGLVEISEVTVTNGVTEKFYRALAGAYLIQQMVTPNDNRRKTIIFSGSHDLAIEQLTHALGAHINLLSLPVGSLDGLIALRQGFCHIAGSHLLDTNGEYNTPYVQRLLSDRSPTMITLAYREQGLIVATGNPKGIHDLSDLIRADVTFINRQPGSGTRLWLDAQLKKAGIPSTEISGYANSVHTHTETAQAIQSGKADAGIGLQASAMKLNLSFIPLFNERYDLTLMQDQSEYLAPLLNHLQTKVCRKEMARLSGYDTTHTGEKLVVV